MNLANAEVVRRTITISAATLTSIAAVTSLELAVPMPEAAVGDQGIWAPVAAWTPGGAGNNPGGLVLNYAICRVAGTLVLGLTNSTAGAVDLAAPFTFDLFLFKATGQPGAAISI